MPDVQPGWWAVVGVVGGWVAKIFTDWLGYRSRSEETEVAHEATAVAGFVALAAEYRMDVDRLRTQVAELEARATVSEAKHMLCEAQLAAAHTDLADLRDDLGVLRDTVIAQINLEADKDGHT